MLVDVIAKPFADEKGHHFLRITIPVRIANKENPQTMTQLVDALWDTGATNTSIRMDIARALGISLIEETKGSKVTSSCSAYFCKFLIVFPDGRALTVEEGNAVANLRTPLIIGMDLISQGTSLIIPLPDGCVRLRFSLGE